MEFVLIGLCTVILVGLIVLGILFAKINQKVENPPIDLKEIGALSKQLDLLSNQIKADIELSLSKEMNKVNENAIKTNET
ncbi:MAG: hypothetical protein II502_03515, partial [Paludibacteraceae bacterium]|nr:hypothetical protein [Paludibacteraceae bacterium]